MQESFRRHLHADGTWSLLHLGSGRWVRTFRDSGLLAAEAVTLDDAERFGVRVDPLGRMRRSPRRPPAPTPSSWRSATTRTSPGRETEDRPHLRLPDAAVERVARRA